MISGAFAVIAGLGIVIFLSAYFFFKLGELTGLEHLFLQLIMFGFVISSVSILGVAVYEQSFNCELVVSNTTESAGDVVYSYEEECSSSASNGAKSFLTMTTWFTRLSFVYLFLYLLFKVLDVLGKLPKSLSRRDD